MSKRTRADLIFKHALLIDGTGCPAYIGDVAVADERIVAVGDGSDVEAGKVIDATGKVVAPGFIDTHTHDDCALLRKPEMAMKASQGVTTVVVGNCGASLAPLVADQVPPPLDLVGRGEVDRWYRFSRFADYLGELDESPPAVNAVCLVGHMTLRVAVMERTDRVATSDEIKRMRTMLDESLEAGAAGFSTGLGYAPNVHATTAEIIEVGADLKRHGGIYATHMRDEGDTIIEAMDESFEIGRVCDVPVVVSHFKCYGEANYGRSPETLAYIEHAASKQPVGFDVYPYSAASTVLDKYEVSLSPKVVITGSLPHPEMAGRELSDVAAEWGLSIDETIDRLNPAGGTYYGMKEEDVRRILAHPGAMIGSDGIPDDPLPHPRLWGTFPRVLGHYVREVGLFSLEEAVRKMTSLPAGRFGLEGRGRLKVGGFADLVLFDPSTVGDTATYDAPIASSAGIEQVLVNGRVVWREGESTGERPGRVLR